MARPRPNRITAHIHAAVERIDSICGRARNDIRARLLEHIDEHPNSPWSYANVARLERTLAAMYQQWGSSVNAVFDDFLPREYQAGYERAKADLTRSGVWQNITGGPDLRRIRNALDSVYNNVALRTDKMTFDHIRQLRNFSAKVFREASITGETRRQVSDRLQQEALQVPGFQFTDIAGRKWSHQSYFEMLARTELMNGARDSYEQQCAAEGYNIMLLSVSGHCCEACAKYEGQYFSIGPNQYGLPTKDDLEAAGVFHPNCTHSYSAVPDYIIEKEFGKQEKGSSPKSPSNLPRVASAENLDGKTFSEISAQRPKSEVYAQQVNPDLQSKIIKTKVDPLTDDAVGKIKSFSVAEDLPKDMHGATDKEGNIVIDPATAADLNSAYDKAKAGRDDFTEAELNAIETVTHEINHLRQSNVFSEKEEDRFVILATEIVNEELTRHLFREQAGNLGFKINDDGMKFIQEHARSYSGPVPRLRNIADALGCSEKYQDLVCNELAKTPGRDKVTKLINFFTKEMDQQGLSPDFELFTNDFFENEKGLVQWIRNQKKDNSH